MLVLFVIFCAAPRDEPLMSGEGYPMIFVSLLGITNGVVGSVPMIQAPRRVSEEHRELAGIYFFIFKIYIISSLFESMFFI